MATSQSKNRIGNVGSGNGGRMAGAGGDDDANSLTNRAIAGMVFFGCVAFVCLPISVMILVEAKKTNVDSHAALNETKKLQAEMKMKKEKDDE